MDDNQSTQQSSDGDLQITHTRHRKKTPSRNFLIRVLQRSPWLLWLVLWLSLFIATSLSIFSLTYAGFGTRQARPLPPIIVETPASASSRNDSQIALWVLGAIFVCGAGYWFVFRQLQAPPKPKRIRLKRQQSRDQRLQRLNSLKEVPQTAPTTPLVEPLISVPPVEPAPPKPPISEPEVISAPEYSNVPDDNNDDRQAEPVITILPPEASPPVDVENVSLAEMMDMRKHRSLSSILGKDYQPHDKETPNKTDTNPSA